MIPGVVASGVSGSAPFSPLSVTWHSAFWAEDPAWSNPGNGNAVSSWNDASGNGRHATQATAGNRPTFRSSTAVLNSKPTVQFDGVNDWLSQATFTALSEPGEIVIVGALTSTATAYGYFVDGTGAGGGPRWTVGKSGAVATWELFQGAIIDTGATDLLGHYFDAQFASGANDKLIVDGTTVISGDAGSRQCDSLTIGAALSGGSSFMPCHIAFIGLKGSALTTQERTDLRTWAQSYYATP